MSEHITTSGTLLAVATVTVGDELAADATAGDTMITLTDAADFAEDGGTLSINDQLVDYTSCDDVTGVVVLVDPLAGDALAGDEVLLADPSGSIASELRATVQVVGSLDSDEPVEAVIAHPIVPLLHEGIRDPGTGESVTLELPPGSEWQVTNVHGRKPTIDRDNAHDNNLDGLSRLSVSYSVPDITTWTSAGVGDWTIDEQVGSAFGIRAGSQIDMFEPGIYAVTLSLAVGGIDVAASDCSVRANVSFGTAPITYIGCGVRGGDEAFGLASASCTYYQPGTGDAGEIGCDIRVNNLDTVNVGFIGVTVAVQQIVR